MNSSTPDVAVPHDRLRAVHDAAGAAWARIGAGPDREPIAVPRHYGDPAAEYATARSAAVAVDRAERAVVRVFGKDPVKMIHGLVTNDVAALGINTACYAAMLTAKGRMLADMRVIRRAEDLLLETDVGELANVLATLKKYVPPLFARHQDVSDSLGVIGVYGPQAGAVIGRVLSETPTELAENTTHALIFEGEIVLSLATAYAGTGFDLIAPAHRLEGLWKSLVAQGARPMGHAALDVLRIEAGRPRWGAELHEDVIPLEAGLLERAISTIKGCYTGQEVVVRILHRGHVNRHLRGMLLGEAPAPPRGTELFHAGDAKPAGTVTSACVSPALAQTIALGYVRREVEPPASLRLGSPDGPEARIVELPFPPSPSPSPSPSNQP